MTYLDFLSAALKALRPIGIAAFATGVVTTLLPAPPTFSDDYWTLLRWFSWSFVVGVLVQALAALFVPDFEESIRRFRKWRESRRQLRGALHAASDLPIEAKQMLSIILASEQRTRQLDSNEPGVRLLENAGLLRWVESAGYGLAFYEVPQPLWLKLQQRKKEFELSEAEARLLRAQWEVRRDASRRI